MTSKYINQSRRNYSLYVLQMRAIPSIIDGLKAGARRILWVAKDGEKYKSATLAGKAMPLHPHGETSLQGAINTLAAPYGNNLPLLEGHGAFGTLLNPTAYGASRYTSVKLSKFAKDVLLTDIELVPMVENYDGTVEEPKHFLPLVPLVLLNPTQGIAVGFATNILPRDLNDVIDAQIQVLQNKKVCADLYPEFTPTASKAVLADTENSAYYFEGEVEIVNKTTVKVVSLPYGLSHEKFINHLEKLIEKDRIVGYEDNSNNAYDIDVVFKRGILNAMRESDLMSVLGLKNKESENLTFIDFNHQSVLNASPRDVVDYFTKWRLQWFVQRYQRLYDIVDNERVKLEDFIKAVDLDVGQLMVQAKSKQALVSKLAEHGIVNADYIASLPIYRFTEEERTKVSVKIEEARETLDYYQTLLNDENERRKVYITELKSIQKRYNNGTYQTST